MTKVNQSSSQFKNYAEAIRKADETTPANMETLIRLNNKNNYPIKTKEDVRFYVLINYIRSIDEALNKTLEDAYLRRIQDNILYAAEMYLK